MKTPNILNADDTENSKNRNILSSQPVNYKVIQTDNLFSEDNSALLDYISVNSKNRRQIAVIDTNVNEIYGDEICSYYGKHGIDLTLLSIDVCENTKSLDSVLEIIKAFESFGVLHNSTPILAIGGGVLLDIEGFAASIYRRGVPYIRVPTNLMALIDASLGVKTAINIGDRRNRLGTYYPPLVALLDRSFLRTVSGRDISNGLGEILKLAVIKDKSLFDLLEKHGEFLLESKFQDHKIAPQIVSLSIHGMLDELAPNLWEKNLERCVDFGHSFSPLVEMRALPELLHGETVTLDVIFSCRLSLARGMLSYQEFDRILKTTVSLGLNVSHPMFEDENLLWEALEDTTKHRDGLQHLPIPTEIGKYTFINDVSKIELNSILHPLAKKIAV